MKTAMFALLSILFVEGATRAELTRDEQKNAKAMLKGTLWLRLDVPCETGRQPYGIYHKPLIEVSPTGANTDVSNQVSIGWYHAGSTDWSARINDSVELDDFDVDGSTIEIEFEGAGASEGRDSTLQFVRIGSFDDFQAAFDRTFSRVPLQEEHADWPPEIKQAIADRRLVDGMSKRQVFYVVGQPESVEKKTEGGNEIEIWMLRSKGLEFGYFGTRAAGPQGPQSLRFENGKLKLDASKLPGSAVKLDD